MSRFYKPTAYNGDTRTQMWMSMVTDGHDIYCGCVQPIAHLLDVIFPEGHTDRGKSIQQILERDIQLCHSGGAEEENHGIPVGGSAAGLAGLKEEKDTTEDKIDALLAAAAADAEEQR